ncbi:hypothetical protein BH20BAC1_BH20BAC1_22440 [soil metagenome]
MLRVFFRIISHRDREYTKNFLSTLSAFVCAMQVLSKMENKVYKL